MKKWTIFLVLWPGDEVNDILIPQIHHQFVSAMKKFFKNVYNICLYFSNLNMFLNRYKHKKNVIKLMFMNMFLSFIRSPYRSI
jgi:hypothetical protein